MEYVRYAGRRLSDDDDFNRPRFPAGFKERAGGEAEIISNVKV